MLYIHKTWRPILHVTAAEERALGGQCGSSLRRCLWPLSERSAAAARGRRVICRNIDPHSVAERLHVINLVYLLSLRNDRLG